MVERQRGGPSYVIGYLPISPANRCQNIFLTFLSIKIVSSEDDELLMAVEEITEFCRADI